MKVLIHNLDTGKQTAHDVDNIFQVEKLVEGFVVEDSIRLLADVMILIGHDINPLIVSTRE